MIFCSAQTLSVLNRPQMFTLALLSFTFIIWTRETFCGFPIFFKISDLIVASLNVSFFSSTTSGLFNGAILVAMFNPLVCCLVRFLYIMLQ